LQQEVSDALPENEFAETSDTLKNGFLERRPIHFIFLHEAGNNI
jgi:hypothetical protein